MSRLSKGQVARAGFFAGAAGTGIAAVATAAAWHWLARRPLPKQRGTIAVEGLEGRVRVRRDRWGVPHVEADAGRDLYFAQGFVHAQDRLWQMDFYRRAVEGRISEMAGAEGLPIDRLMRTLGIRRVAAAEEAALDPELRALLERFCEGVNAAAASASALPFEMQLLRLSWKPWRPVDVLSLGKLLAFGLSTNWERELLRADMLRALGPELTARLDPTYPADNPVVTQEAWSGDGLAIVEQIDAVRRSMGLAAEASGSNNWAVSGELSATGAPLIAGDPHLPPSMPGIWYQVALRHGNRFVRGASMPGMPGVYMGQNNDVCWTFTNVMADVQDLFVERIEGERYLYEDEWKPLQTVHEEIVVKGREEPVELKVRITHHGPIVNAALGADEAEPLALSWLALREPTAFAGMFELLEIGSGPDLVAKLEGHTAPASNLIWADRDSIGYKLIGRLPRRRGGCPDLPKPGWSGEFEWEGTIPYDELPQQVDPESGYLITANNRIVGDEYPHHITSEYLDGFRAKRIEQLLGQSDEHHLEGFEAMQSDNLSLPGIEAARRLGRLTPRGQRELSAVERLRSWDGRLDPDTIAGTIYQAFLLRLAREVARAAIGDRDLCERWLDRADNGFTPHVTSPWRWHSHLMGLWEEADEELVGRPWDELVLEALAGALDDLEERFGPDPEGWRWGHVHEMEFPHPLGDANPLLRRLLNRRLRAGGAQETVSQIAYDPNDPYKAVWAPSWRMVADPTDPERSRWQMFTGQSGHPASPHYDDLQADWLEGRTQPMSGEGPWSELELVPSAD
ncbi:MAG: peptidase penicillin amidase [Solirubrobacterales bacterium]|nr:peptidase penicillin amidase [Solirubrobacterales bacterium]